MEKQATVRRPVGRPPKAENQRARIIAEAARLIGSKGYENCSLTDIAVRLGISKQALYHYFNTKDEIYTEIMQSTLEGLHDHVKSRIDLNAPALAQLRQLMRAHAEFLHDQFWQFAALLTGFGGIGMPESRRSLVVVRDRYEHLVREVLDRGVASGEFAVADVNMTARAILSMLNWMVRWYQTDGPLPAVAVADTYFELITNGITCRPGALRSI
ncbi:MAG: TetR/AcrR family transcriptional regulator [Gammaproteobacteria bacterium]|nr:TetR/AcrR family transcriptional regulator [Gammaproteobacteria bacterium]MBI5617245.1 TetR/AcrR family transcriptional regulator [Gammaproteobacteria bacterium]